MQTFDAGTPCDIRVVGVTLHGKAREAEMLDATQGCIIKGEWRYPTQALQALISAWFTAGEWFVPAASHCEHFARTNVAGRVESKYPVGPTSIGYHWAQDVLNCHAEDDPLLGIDWSGYERAQQRPSLTWPRMELAA
jgi:hypothetical protein